MDSRRNYMPSVWRIGIGYVPDTLTCDMGDNMSGRREYLCHRIVELQAELDAIDNEEVKDAEWYRAEADRRMAAGVARAAAFRQEHQDE